VPARNRTGVRNEDTNRRPQTETGRFGELTVSGNVSRALRKMGYETPAPIQDAVIPLVREGRDVVGQAQTGTGKTAAFGIPIVEMLDPNLREPQALVLTPTRELAVQVNEEISKLGEFQGIRGVAIYGGQPMKRQLAALQRGMHVIVATPGRLLDHMQRGTIGLGRLRMVVLDEADQMLDIGFAPDIERILRRTPHSRQTMLFSATMPRPIKGLVNRYLTNPAWTRVGGEAEPVEQVEQIYYEVAERDRSAALEKLLGEPGRITQALIFRRTKIGVDKLVAILRRRGYEAEAIHGDMPQSRRDRVMSGFRNEQIPILIATNVAARGLDLPAVSHVINYDMPSNLEEYVHRIGRTARMGRPGTAITFVSEWDFETLDVIQAHVGEGLKRERLAFLYA
jgi:ATP-dependent RNA helicase DeaD